MAKNYEVARFGPFDALDAHVFQHPKRTEIKAKGKVFLKQPLGLTGAEISLNKFPPGRAVPFLHRHEKHEEVFLGLGGKGELIVDGEVIPIEQGTAVRVAPEGARSIRNAGSEDFFYACIQVTKDSMPDEATVTDGRPVEGPVRWPAV